MAGCCDYSCVNHTVPVGVYTPLSSHLSRHCDLFCMAVYNRLVHQALRLYCCALACVGPCHKPSTCCWLHTACCTVWVRLMLALATVLLLRALDARATTRAGCVKEQLDMQLDLLLHSTCKQQRSTTPSKHRYQSVIKTEVCHSASNHALNRH